MMPEKHFNFFIPKQNKTISNLTIGSGNYGISVQKDALLYGIEHDGNDVLWIEEGALQTKFKYRIPNYFNIELDKDYVKGVFRSAFYKEDWINGKWEMIIPNIYNDSNLTLELIIASSDKKPHNLVIWLYDTEIFNKDIQNGTWKYTFNIKTGEILDKYRIRFFSDLTRDATDERILNGLKVFSFKLIDSTLINKKFFQFNNPKLQNTIIVEPRRNIDFSQLNLKAGDSISLPFRITNYGANKLELGKQDVFFKFKWFGFILKSLEHVQSHKLALNGDLAPGESVEVFLTMKVPAEAKKYFMDMNLFDKNDKELFDKYYKRQFLVDLREK